jgi:hypothetical protein
VNLFLGVVLIAAGMSALFLMLAAREGRRGGEGWPGPRGGGEAPDGADLSTAPSGAGTSPAPGASERHAAPGADLTDFDEHVAQAMELNRPVLDDDYVLGAFAGIVALNFSHLINGRKDKP